jgi:ABC-type antimicrobial peptide transport system permease subunit
LRTAGSPLALAAALRSKIHELDRTATVSDVHTVEQEFDRSLSRERLVGTITGLFGTLSLLLAAIGLYGLLSYGTLQRTREFGVRIAIGATAGSIVRLVVGEALGLLAAGTALGLAAAWALGSVVSSMLFGVDPADPASAALSVVVLATAALVAAWIPARRASRVDPTRALRFE